MLKILGLALSDASCEREAHVEPMWQLLGHMAAAMTAVPNAEEVAQDLLSGDAAAADRAQGDQISGSILAVAQSSRVACGGLLFKASTTKSYSQRSSVTKGLPPVAERPLLVAKAIKAEGETSPASILTRLNRDRGGDSPFTKNSLTSTFKFLCDAELVSKNLGYQKGLDISGTGRGPGCTYKMNKTHTLQQLKFAVEEQWDKKQRAKKEKKQEAKKRSKCVIAKLQLGLLRAA